jgi:hypothetical protein
MTDPTGANKQLKLHPQMKLHTFAFTVFEDAIGTRTRCCFCGALHAGHLRAKTPARIRRKPQHAQLLPRQRPRALPFGEKLMDANQWNLIAQDAAKAVLGVTLLMVLLQLQDWWRRRRR